MVEQIKRQGRILIWNGRALPAPAPQFEGDSIVHTFLNPNVLYKCQRDSQGNLRWRQRVDGDGISYEVLPRELDNVRFANRFSDIQRALDMIPRKPVYLPPRLLGEEFEVDTPIIIRSNYHLAGYGRDSILKQADGADINVIEIEQDADNFTLDNFAIDGNAANNAAGNGIDAQNGCVNGNIKHLEIYACIAEGINMLEGVGTTLNVAVHKCFFHDNGVRGILLTTPEGSEVTFCHAIDNTNIGISVTGAGHRNRVIGNFSIRNLYGMEISGAENEVIGNTCYNNTRFGIFLGSAVAQYNDLIGNECMLNGRDGILLISARYNNLIDNRCTVNGDTYAGIQLTNIANNNILSKNFCRNDPPGFLQEYGILLGVNTYNNKVLLNTCIDNDTADILDNGNNILGYLRKVRVQNPIAPANIHAQFNADFDTGAGLTQFLHPHNIQIVANGAWVGGDVTITGVLLDGRLGTEVITPLQGLTVLGNVPFMSITNLQGTIGAGTLDFQTSTGLGLHYHIQSVIKEITDDALDPGGTVAPLYGTIIPNTAFNGARDYDYYFITDENYYE